MTSAAAGPVRRVRFVADAARVPAPSGSTLVVVLDPGFVAEPTSRPDVVAARTGFVPIVARVDLFDDALQRADQFAAGLHLADRLQVEGATVWFRVRETAWRWLHERLAWLAWFAAAGLDPEGLVVSYPAAEAAIADAVRALGATAQPEPGSSGPTEGSGAAVPPRTPATASSTRVAAWDPRRWLAGRGGRNGGPTPAPPDGRDAELAARVDRLAAGSRPRVLVLTTPATWQRVAGGERRDPILGSVIEPLVARDLEVIRIGIGLDSRRDDDWAVLASARDLLPQSLLRTRWGRPADRDRSAAAVAGIRSALSEVSGARLDVDGADLGPALLDLIGAELERIVEADVLQSARIERLVAELRPAAIVLAQEGIRTPWLRAGRDAGIPTLAVQHGVLYPGHAGYPNVRHPSLILPTTTFVYGDYERRVLVDELAYEPTEVEVSGSPRLDLDASAGGVTAGDPGSADERAAIRMSLGIASEDRMLVVSTVHVPVIQRVHLLPMIERLLCDPPSRVHVVFKQHPGERDDGPYRSLLDGLAATRGVPPPPISVVRDIDLYALLRAADAHLGLHSTVLTDAVAANCPNLVAMTDAHHDLVGYVAAGVAVPIAEPTELAAALERPVPPDPARRAAFLADHFRPGDAGTRIAEAIVARIGAAGRTAGSAP